MGDGSDSDNLDSRGSTDPHRLAPAPRPDEIFADFVRRANAEWVESVETLLAELEADVPRDPEGTDRIVRPTPTASSPPPPARGEVSVGAPAADLRRRPRVAARARDKRRPLPGGTENGWSSVVPQRSETTQRREAKALVPDVASVSPPPTAAPEGSEDGLVPSGELDRKLADMDVLVRYGHVPEVQSELEALRLGYPRDLLLLRRIAELYVKHALRGPALEALFTLAAGLFQRRNIEGMREALEQVRVLAPANERAARLLALLDRRPSAPPPRGS